MDGSDSFVLSLFQRLLDVDTPTRWRFDMFLGGDKEDLRHKKVTSTYPSSTCHITPCLHERSRNKHIRKGKFQRFLHAKRHTAPSILKEGNAQHNRGLTRVQASASTVTAANACIKHISCPHRNISTLHRDKHRALERT